MRYPSIGGQDHSSRAVTAQPTDIAVSRRHACCMSFVTSEPEALIAAAGSLQSIGAAMNATNASAIAPITSVVPAAADEVSALTAAHFGAHGALYEAVSAQAAAIHELFVTTLGASGGSYAATEAANAVAAR